MFSRRFKYQIEAKPRDDKEIEVEKLQIALSKISSATEFFTPQWLDMVKEFEYIASAAILEQEQPEEEPDSTLWEKNTEVVVRTILEKVKMITIFKIYTKGLTLIDKLPKLLSSMPGVSPDSLECSFYTLLQHSSLLVKCCLDAKEGVALVGKHMKSILTTTKQSLISTRHMFTLDSEHAHNAAPSLGTLGLYWLYNVARRLDELPQGLEEDTCRMIGEEGLVEEAMRTVMELPEVMGDDAVITLAELLAALADAEPFMDYIDSYLPDEDVVDLFLRFYDACVLPLMGDPEERPKMLSLEEVVAWIREEYPDMGL
eukprot:gnl/Dysnectes_brevis/3992_a5204_651.p1 GENE.gnl/Dysnectes_brevis/3992_a5204_651~~gnl/Dysnectes_brevis/3992_a5204_651.p1  ORF type:complete len:315 (+),score=62.38 gnl/Dysnectes_brevis/3992_a5204_651:37-981(+)